MKTKDNIIIRDNIIEIRKTMALLNSMIISGEKRSHESEKEVFTAYKNLTELEQLLSTQEDYRKIDLGKWPTITSEEELKKRVDKLGIDTSKPNNYYLGWRHCFEWLINPPTEDKVADAEGMRKIIGNHWEKINEELFNQGGVNPLPYEYGFKAGYKFSKSQTKG